jgi:hypothetical protein
VIDGQLPERLRALRWFSIAQEGCALTVCGRPHASEVRLATYRAQIKRLSRLPDSRDRGGHSGDVYISRISERQRGFRAYSPRTVAD